MHDVYNAVSIDTIDTIALRRMAVCLYGCCMGWRYGLAL
jgi:hypothetical protein